MPKFGLPGLEPGRWSPGGRFGKEKQKPDPNHARPNLPTALAQHTPRSAPPPVMRPASPASEAASSPRRRSKPVDVPAYQPAVGRQHLLSAREMASHPNNVPSEVVLHLLGATNVPRNESLNISSLSSYVVAWVIDHRGQPAGKCVRWPVRPDTRQPVWNVSRGLGLPPLSYRRLRRATLHAQVWHADLLLPDTLMGELAVPLLSLLCSAPRSSAAASLKPHSARDGSGAPACVEVPLAPPSEAEAGPAEQLLALTKRGVYGAARLFQPATVPTPRPLPCTVQLRLVRGYPARKWLYLVRHGESEWNRAQGALDLGAMFSQVDHPLSKLGFEQAHRLAAKLGTLLQSTGPQEQLQAQLLEQMSKAPPREHGAAGPDAKGPDAKGPDATTRAAEAERRLGSGVQQVLCSPLSRAVETCLVALAPLLQRKNLPVTLAPNAREHFRGGGADSLGTATGGVEVRARVREHLLALCANAAEADALLAPHLEDDEVRCRWWSVLPESSEELQERVAELLRQVRFSPHEHIVVVGHSLFIRELFRELSHPTFFERAPELAAALRTQKLENCGVVCAELELGGGRAPPIVDAHLMLGSQLEEKKKATTLLGR